MASKAELEAEVAELKRMLAEVQASRAAEEAASRVATGIAADEAAEAVAATDAAGAETPPPQAGAHAIEPLLGRLVEEARVMHARQPLLTVAGAFLAGFVFGRTR